MARFKSHRFGGNTGHSAAGIAAAAAVAALTWAGAAPVRGAIYTWNTTTGNWSDGADWSWFGTGVVPGDGSYATIAQPGAVVNLDYTYTENNELSGLNLTASAGNVQLTQSSTSSAMMVDYYSASGPGRDSEIIQGTGAYYAYYLQSGGSNFTDGFELVGNAVYQLDAHSADTGSLYAGPENVGSGAYFAQGGGTNTASFLNVYGKFVLGYQNYNLNPAGVLGGPQYASYRSGTTESILGGVFVQAAETTNNASSLAVSGTGARYDLIGGNLSVGNIRISGTTRTLVTGAIIDAASFTQAGGSVNDALGGSDLTFYLNPSGTFNYFDGTFDARLINQGTFTLSGAGSFDAGNGMENDVAFTISAGQTISLDGQGLNNQATMTIQGGALSGGGILTNNSQMYILGTISGTGGFVNNGTVGITYMANATQIVLSNTGANVNNGSVQLSQGYSLNLSGNSVALANAGTVTLNGGAINGTGTLDNNSGGTVEGPGIISANLSNSGGEIDANGGTITLTSLLGNTNGGELLINDNSEINSLLAFSSTGEVVLIGNNAVLTGGAITNSGTISGFGRVGNTVSNSGTIRADGGTLTLTGGGVTNAATGNIEAGTGNSVVFAQGLATNAGTIALSGGTFDNNNNALQISTTGYLVGSGTVRTGGLTNLNSISMADAATAFYGPVINGYAGSAPTNAPTPTIQITNTTTTFYGPVTNESGALIISTGAVIRYLGAFVNNGTAISDPSTTTFTTLTEGTTGVTELSAGDEYKILLNFYNNSTQNTAWDTSQGILEFTGNAHTMTVAGSDKGASSSGFTNNFAWGQLILDSGGSLSLGNGTGLSAGTNGAFYTYILTLAGGVSQIANITGNGVSIYYDPTNSANAYLGDKTYSLTNGGEIAPVPEPAPVALLAIAGAGMLLRRRGFRKNGLNSRE